MLLKRSKTKSSRISPVLRMKEAVTVEQDNGRITELDGVRAIAIVLVLIWHYGNNQVVYELNSFTKYFRILTSMFWSGVDLFFVLSGFLIGRILLINRDRSNYFSVFYLRRTFRIFPLYYFLVFSFLICAYLGLGKYFPHLMSDPHPAWSYLLFVQNYFMGEADFGAKWLGVTWSLAVEEQFYLLLPITIYSTNFKKLPYLLVALILLAPLFRIILPSAHAFVSLLSRMDALLIGVLLAYLTLMPNALIILRNNLKYLYMAFVVLLAGVITFTILFADWYPSYVYSWLAVFYAVILLIALSDRNGLVAKILNSPILLKLGTISYGVYIFHELTTYLLHQLLLNQSPRIASLKELAVTMLSLVVTILAATLSYHYFEKPFLKIGKSYRYQ